VCGTIVTTSERLGHLEERENVQSTCIVAGYQRTICTRSGCSTGELSRVAFPRGCPPGQSCNSCPTTTTQRIQVNPSSVTLTVGGGADINATLIGINGAIEWFTSDKDIVTVNGNGKISAKAPGLVTITARSKSNKNISGSCSVLVLPRGHVIDTLPPKPDPGPPISRITTNFLIVFDLFRNENNDGSISDDEIIRHVNSVLDYFMGEFPAAKLYLLLSSSGVISTPDLNPGGKCQNGHSLPCNCFKSYNCINEHLTSAQRLLNQPINNENHSIRIVDYQICTYAKGECGLVSHRDIQGMARINGKDILVSTHEIKEERIEITILHELSHLFGIWHCSSNDECVMKPSIHNEKVIRKWCEDCKDIIADGIENVNHMFNSIHLN
jgi:hypothetical protein